MKAMKRLCLFLACSGALAFAADLAGARTVYVLSMSRGLDQFLANRLTNEHVFQVVTDPKLADVILTDRLGESFQAQLESISPSPDADEEDDKTGAKPPAKAEAKADAKADAKPAVKADSKSDATADSADASVTAMFSAPVNKLDRQGLNSTFGRNKGTIFLVDAKSRQVIWSTFDPPRGFANKEMDRTASDIVSRLKKDMQKKK
jgi:hypothetical protein